MSLFTAMLRLILLYRAELTHARTGHRISTPMDYRLLTELCQESPTLLLLPRVKMSVRR
jgi:hypothetical protein